MPWLVRIGIVAAWAALGGVVWTALRDVREEARRERGLQPRRRR